MVGSKAEKDHSRRVGKNCVTIGFCRTDNRDVDMLYYKTQWFDFPPSLYDTVRTKTLNKLHSLHKQLINESPKRRNVNNLNTHIQILHWFGHIKLVHGGNYNGWGGKEEEEEEKDAVYDE